MFKIGVNSLKTAVFGKTLKERLPHFYKCGTALGHTVKSSKKLLPGGLCIGHHFDEVFGVLGLSVAPRRLLDLARIRIEALGNRLEELVLKVEAQRGIRLENLASNSKPNRFPCLPDKTLASRYQGLKRTLIWTLTAAGPKPFKHLP